MASRADLARTAQIDQMLGQASRPVPQPDPRLQADMEMDDPGMETELDLGAEADGPDGPGAAPPPPGADMEDPEHPAQSWAERQRLFYTDKKKLKRDHSTQTLKARKQVIQRRMGIVVPEKALDGAFARTVMGQNVVEWDNGSYVRDGGGKIAMAGDVENQTPDEAIRAAVQLAHQKGWSSLKFDGDPRLGDLVWMEAQRYGMSLENFEPSMGAMERAPKYLQTVGPPPQAETGPDGEPMPAQGLGTGPGAVPGPDGLRDSGLGLDRPGLSAGGPEFEEPASAGPGSGGADLEDTAQPGRRGPGGQPQDGRPQDGQPQDGQPQDGRRQDGPQREGGGFGVSDTLPPGLRPERYDPDRAGPQDDPDGRMVRDPGSRPQNGLGLEKGAPGQDAALQAAEMMFSEDDPRDAPKTSRPTGPGFGPR